MRVLALLVLPLCGVLSFGIGRSDAPLAKCPRDGDDPNAAATCGKCHKDHYDEWHGRSHANAWVDPIYQAELKTKSKPESCHACHIPSEVLKRLGKKPEVRKELLDDGVGCVACHKVGDTIHGPFGAKTDAHPSEKDAVFEGANPGS